MEVLAEAMGDWVAMMMDVTGFDGSATVLVGFFIAVTMYGTVMVGQRSS